MEKTYKCTGCKQYKQLSEFYRNASTSTKRATKCKVCMRIDSVIQNKISKAKREEAKRAQKEKFIYYGTE